jgi:hypothetical protein
MTSDLLVALLLSASISLACVLLVANPRNWF